MGTTTTACVTTAHLEILTVIAVLFFVVWFANTVLSILVTHD